MNYILSEEARQQLTEALEGAQRLINSAISVYNVVAADDARTDIRAAGALLQFLPVAPLLDSHGDGPPKEFWDLIHEWEDSPTEERTEWIERRLGELFNLYATTLQQSLQATTQAQPAAGPPGIEGLVYAVAVGTNPQIAAVFDTHTQAHTFVAWLKRFVPRGAPQEEYAALQSEAGVTEVQRKITNGEGESA